MSMVALAAAAVVVGAGTTVAANQSSSKALKSASGRQAAAIASLEPLNQGDLDRIATKAAQANFTKSVESQKKLDPTFAALRSTGSANALAGLTEDANPNSVANKSIKEASDTLASSKDSNDAIIGQLLDRVKADLDAGATLPPEFQAELVRSGLESAGNNGTNIDGRGATGAGIRTLLGSAGLALKERRETNARTNLSAAETLRNSRMEALKNLGITSSDLIGAKVSRGVGGTVVGNSNMPSIGLTGPDAAGIAIQNNQLRNNQKLGIANAQNQNTLGQAQLTASSLGAVGSGLSSLAGGQYGTWVGGLLKTDASGKKV